jgi:hypothetical protein
MRRFFISLFVISLLATAGTVFWRTYAPEGLDYRTTSAERSFVPDGSTDRPSARAYRREPADEKPSERQDLALMLSIASSVISAVAALVQTWLTARPPRR